MRDMTTVNINVKINEFVTGTSAGKAFSLLTLREMVNKLSTIIVKDDGYKTSVMEIIGKESIKVIQSYEEYYLSINSAIENDNNEIKTVANAVHEFFPYAEGTMLTIEARKYQPEIAFFTRGGIVKDNVKDVRFEQKDKTVMPYIDADYDDELSFEECDILDAFIKNCLKADDELVSKVRKIVKEHVTTFAE